MSRVTAKNLGEQISRITEGGIAQYYSLHPESLKVCYSWGVLGAEYAIKVTDKSIFKNNGSGIPKQIAKFWGTETLAAGQKKPITLLFQGENYYAYIKGGQQQILWYANFSKEINSMYDAASLKEGTFPLMVFEKEGKNKFSVSLS